MPCAGCKKNMNDPEGRFKMRFIGRDPNGKLMKGAPGNYQAGKVYEMPFRHSRYKWWQLIEPVPELVVPPISEEGSVFEEAYHVDWEEDMLDSTHDARTLTATAPIEVLRGTGVLGGDTATIESMKDYERSLTKVEEMPVLQEKPEVVAKEETEFVDSREDLMAKLDAAGIEYNRKSHSKTLQALVEKLESEEGS